jgi:hypothetical protein
VDDCTAAGWCDKPQAALAGASVAAAPVICAVADDLVRSREVGCGEEGIERFRVVGLAWADKGGDDEGRVRVYAEMDLTVGAPLLPVDSC